MAREIDYDEAKKFDKEHCVFKIVCDAFEDRGGGCGHDLGLTGAIAVIQAWEKIRTDAKLKELMHL